MPKASHGVLDLSAWDFERDGAVNLDGQWAFYWRALIPPSAFKDQNSLPPSGWIAVPGTWRGQKSRGKPLSGYGYATYHLRIKLRRKSFVYGLKINNIGTAYTLWANGKRVAANGVVGTSEAAMKPQTLPRVIYNNTDTSTLELVLHVSNFVDRTGGAWDQVQFGNARQISELRDHVFALDLIPLGIVLVMSLYHLLLFVLRRKEPSTLIFGLFCADIGLRTVLMGERLLIQLVPTFNWYLAFKLEVLTLVFGPLLTVMYVRYVYRRETPRLIVLILQVFAIVYSLFVAAVPPKIFTELLPVVQGYGVICIIFTIYTIIVAKVRKRQGTNLILSGIIILFGTGINDILVANEVYVFPYLLPIGFLALLFCQAALLSMRFSKAFTTVENLSSNLEKKVRERTCELEQANDQLNHRTQELQQAYMQLAEHDNLKSRFFANMSHELRTPLTLILTPLQHLLTSQPSPLSDDVSRQLKSMMSNGHRLLRLMNQLLDFSRIASKATVTSLELLNIRDIVEPVVQSFEAFARSKGLRLKFQSIENLPLVYVDSRHLEKVMSNLLSNACKFTSKGGGISVRLDADDNFVTLSVADNGIGINEKDLAKIFDRFYQVDNSATRRFEGSGIGLSLSRELVKLCGGTLEVESEEGIGSTFTVKLPLQKDQPKQVSKPASRKQSIKLEHINADAVQALAAEMGLNQNTANDDSSLFANEGGNAPEPVGKNSGKEPIEMAEQTGGKEEQVEKEQHSACKEGQVERNLKKPPGPNTPDKELKQTGEEGAASLALKPDPINESKPLVLVVEDNLDMRCLIKGICEEMFCVAEAQNGEQALKIIHELQPALIISDVMMPGMDGYELLRRVRSSQAIASTPMMLVTAKAGFEMKLAGLEHGADDYISKPFDPRELKARARNLVRLQEQEKKLRELNSRLHEEVVAQASELERTRMLRRYLSPNLAKAVIEEGQSLELGQRRQHITAFRLELRGFDRMNERVEPEELVAMLNSYLTEVSEVAFSHGATIDRFIRDAVVGFFGAPKSLGAEEDALHCVRMALQMWQSALKICERWKVVLPIPAPLPTMAIASGYTTLGNFGSAQRMEYTAVGGAIDDTQAILSAIHDGEVVCTKTTKFLYHRGELAKKGDAGGEDVKESEPFYGEIKARHRSIALKLYLLARAPAPLVERSKSMLTMTTTGKGKAGSTDDVSSKTEHTTGKAHKAAEENDYIEKIKPGTMIGQRYRVIRSLGQGGTASVYHVYDSTLDIESALKLLLPKRSKKEKWLKRILREVKIARLLNHPNLVRIYDVYEIEEFNRLPFITMEFIQGESLETVMRNRGALEIAEAQAIILQLCAGLEVAHAAGIVHRDFKPANIMIEKTGRVVILDFGLALGNSEIKAFDTQTEGLVGTPCYMAPEQFENTRVDHRADIYALGLIAFEMVTGTRPFKSESIIGVAYKRWHEEAPNPMELRKDLPPRLAAVISRCLKKNLHERIGSMAEISSLLSGMNKRMTASANRRRLENHG